MNMNDFLSRYCRSACAKRIPIHAPQSLPRTRGILPFLTQPQRLPSSTVNNITIITRSLRNHPNGHEVSPASFVFFRVRLCIHSFQIPRTLNTVETQQGLKFVRHTSWSCATRLQQFLPMASQSFKLYKYLVESHETSENVVDCSCCFCTMLLVLCSCFHDSVIFGFMRQSVRDISRI